jgi:omega-amidase
MTGARLTIALGEHDTGWHDSRGSLALAARLARLAASVGADVVVLPEMPTTAGELTTLAAEAATIDGPGAPDVSELRRIARENATWLIAGIALREDRDGSGAVNGSLVIDPLGEVTVQHQRNAPGTAATTLTIGGVRLGLFVCHELRLPHVFAAAAAGVDAMIVIANWPASRQYHWDALLRARAIENQCYVIGVNRTGVADGLECLGVSSVFDPWGDRVTASSTSGTRIIALDTQRVAAVRAEYPFLQAQRV